MMARISVIGAGAFGTALSHMLAMAGHQARLFSRDPEVADYIRNHHLHPRRLQGIALHPRIEAFNDFALVCEGADVIVSALPMSALRGVFTANKNHVSASSAIVSTTKGVERESHLFAHEVFGDVFGNVIMERLAVLSGPSFAREVALGLPTTATLASQYPHLSAEMNALFCQPSFAVEISEDVTGAEVSGAFKNIIALAAGLVEGLHLGHNALAYLMVSGLSEIAQLAAALGGKENTVYGLCGLGDLFLTCTGNLSRNRHVGIELAKGLPLKEVIKNMPEYPEGVYTALSIPHFKDRYGLDLPIMSTVFDVVHQAKAPSQLVPGICIPQVNVPRE